MGGTLASESRRLTKCDRASVSATDTPLLLTRSAAYGRAGVTESDDDSTWRPIHVLWYALAFAAYAVAAWGYIYFVGRLMRWLFP